MEAAEKVKGIKQPGKGYIRKFIAVFKECKRFFDGRISVSSSIELFLKTSDPAGKFTTLPWKRNIRTGTQLSQQDTS